MSKQQPSADQEVQNADSIATKYAPRMSYAWFVIAGRELAAPRLVSDHEAARICADAAITRGATYGYKSQAPEGAIMVKGVLVPARSSDTEESK